MGGDSLRVIVGPTAAGKSAVAMQLAERYHGTIVSADSRQVYRRFDIGTAKPSLADRARVPHAGVDVADPRERVSAGRWAREAVGWIAAARAAGRVPVVVGGTGFYVRALAQPLFEEPPLDPARRAALAAELAAYDTQSLRRWTRAVDPARADLGRAQLIRAIEVATLTGVPITEWYRRGARAPGLAVRYLVLDPSPAALRDRIAARVRAMLDAGWEEETVGLLREVPADAPAWEATGYRAMRALVLGQRSRMDALPDIERATRQYAKRQRTWFRHQLVGADVTCIDPEASGALERAAAWWEGESARA
ncbi:MAG TPA: tRNA (adenosine(37)-N6)-dimethylallyltransferase MiaA [Gemmatimonadaceae bacterium]|nr:tRNA (adenosine(37)-N6)-dimethylallyltransferase MiaA [Gemmatimonadaceae bacterium]